MFSKLKSEYGNTDGAEVVRLYESGHISEDTAIQRLKAIPNHYSEDFRAAVRQDIKTLEWNKEKQQGEVQNE